MALNTISCYFLFFLLFGGNRPHVIWIKLYWRLNSPYLKNFIYWMRRPVVVTTVVHRVAVLLCFPTSALTCLTGSFNEWQINLYLRLSSNCHSRPTVAVDSHLKGKVVEFEFESKCQVGGSGCRNHYAALWGLPLHSCLCVSVCVCVCPSPNITALVQKRAGDCQCVLIITRDKVIIKAELAASACSDIVLKHQLQRDTHLSIRSAPCVCVCTSQCSRQPWLITHCQSVR